MGKAARSGMPRPKATLGSLLRAAVLSEPVAWAVQNASGVLFTILFAVIGRMTFTLACVSACLYSAGSQVLSLDRTIGGRMFGGAVFVGCMLSSGILGGGISSLAWAAHGNAPFLLSYLPSEAQKIPNRYDLGLIEAYLPKLVALPLPKFVTDELAPLIAAIDKSIPEASTAFWALLIVLFAIVSVPFAVGRSSDDLRIGILFAIATLFMGSQVVFASLMPTLGLRLYWTQVTLGYVKVALVNAGAMVVTGILFYALSAFDQIRLKLGGVLQNTGVLLSHIASQANAPWTDEIAARGANREAGAPSEEDIIRALRAEAHALAESIPDPLSKPRVGDLNADGKGALEGADGAEAALGAPMQLHCRSALELEGDLHEIQDLFSSALFEPPLPGLTSQPGANRRKYLAVHAAAGKVVGLAATLAAAVPAIRGELAAMHAFSSGKSEEKTVSEAHQVQDAIVTTLASCAAACADLSVALRHMPLWKKCAGPSIAWRPRDGAFWAAELGKLRAAAALVPDLLTSDAEGALALLSEGRSTPIMLAGCEVLLSLTKSLEAAAAVALDLPVESSATPVAAKVAAAAVEDEGKLQTEASGVADAAPVQPAPSLKTRLLANGYLTSALVLFLLFTGIPVWLVVAKSLVSMAKGLVACLRTRVLANRNVQYALKYWLGLSVTIMGITLILWLGKGNSGYAAVDSYNLTYFFFVWQPVYFWLTAAICIQKQVEAAAFRAVLRALMTGVGGVFGYLTMLNGHLANNPYFITSITCAFNALCGLFSPQKQLRYSLFLAAFTFNAVVICQYFGCCDVPGDPKIFGGKVLSTLLGSIYAMIVSWCIAPYYTSQVMLGLEAQALQNGAKLLREMHSDAKKTASGATLTSKDAPLEGAVKTTELESTVSPATALDWSEQIESSIREPLGHVHKELELNTVDRKQLVLTGIMLPTPQIVAVLVRRIAVLATHLESADQLLHSTLWPGDPGPGQAAMLDALREHIDGVLDATTKTADAAAAFMQASSKRNLSETREVLVGAVSNLETRRAALRAAFVSWKGPGWQGPDLRLLAWVHLMIAAVQDFEVIGLILSETAPALERDRQFSWALSWCGNRPPA